MTVKDLIEQAWNEGMLTSKPGTWAKSWSDQHGSWPAGHWSNMRGLLDQAEAAAAPPPPPPPPPVPPGYPPTGLAVHHFWEGSDGPDLLDYSLAAKFDDAVIHAPDVFQTRSAKFKAKQPTGRALCYQNFGNAGDGVATVLDVATARSRGWLAHASSGAEIANPWGGTTMVVDLGKPGVADAYVAAIRAKADYPGWDGVFADDVNEYNNLWSWGEGIAGYSSPDDYWARATLPLVARVTAALHADGKVLIPNVGDANGYPKLANAIGAASGFFDEYFLVWGNGDSVPPVGVENAHSLVLGCIAAGKVFYGVVHRNDPQGARYAFCAAWIMAGHAPANLRLSVQSVYGSQPLLWDPVYETPLGLPAGPTSHVAGSTVWKRLAADGRTVSIDTASQVGTIA